MIDKCLTKLLIGLHLLLFCCGAVVLPASAEEPLPKIWLSFPPSRDFMDLFKDESAWPQTLKHLDVFALQTTFATNAGDPTLKTIFEFLDKHNIALGLETPILTPGPGDCGIGLEGFRRADVIPALMAKFKRLDAHLMYVTMDEPIWNGHFSTQVKPDGAFACRESIAEVAANAAHNIAIIRRYYPDVIVGEEEPILNQFRGNNDWPANYWEQFDHWLSAFESATGKPIAYETLDVGWFPTSNQAINQQNSKTWPVQLKIGQQILRRHGIPTGIFYNGNPTDTTGSDWIDHAQHRFIYFESLFSEYALGGGYAFEKIYENQKQMINDARKFLDDKRDDMRAIFGQSTVTQVLFQGSVPDAIIDEAKRWDADLIVLGSHGRKGLQRFLIGSVAEKVASYSPCSVEIIKDKQRFLKTKEKVLERCR